MSLVDLHTHTTESDGTYSPDELIRAAVDAGIGTLAITDHDTMTGYDQAAPLAKDAGLDLIRGIELTCKYAGATVHLLGYFFNDAPPVEFENWLEELLEARRDRNRKLIANLQSLGIDITLAEVEKYGRRLTGRPHFARVLIKKGHAANVKEAFDRYLGESGEAFVEREAPTISEALGLITGAGGVPSLAHPTRFRKRLEEAEIAEFVDAGLASVEAFHSDHSSADTERYQTIAAKFAIAVSGGSDFHGDNKPGIQLGTGINGNVFVPEWVVPGLRARSR